MPIIHPVRSSLLKCSRSLAALLVPLAGAPAQAAGGHFDVDDAHVLDRGHCQVETWLIRLTQPASNGGHIGPSCRVGFVELGLNIDRLAQPGMSRDLIGPQAKIVADPLIDGLSVGLTWNVSYDARHGGKPAQGWNLPLTWQMNKAIAINLNAGIDLPASSGSTRRLGLSGEWAASDRWTVIAERITFGGAWTSRVGTRLSMGRATSVDVSIARVAPDASASAPAASPPLSRYRAVTIGLNQDFGR